MSRPVLAVLFGGGAVQIMGIAMDNVERNGSEFKIMDSVYHTKYEDGKVTHIENGTDGDIVCVRFFKPDSVHREHFEHRFHPRNHGQLKLVQNDQQQEMSAGDLAELNGDESDDGSLDANVDIEFDVANFSVKENVPGSGAELDALLQAKQQELEQAKNDNNKVLVDMIEGELALLKVDNIDNRIDEASIEKVMEECLCNNNKATNALLTHDNDIAAAIKYLQELQDVSDHVETSRDQFLDDKKPIHEEFPRYVSSACSASSASSAELSSSVSLESKGISFQDTTSILLKNTSSQDTALNDQSTEVGKYPELLLATFQNDLNLVKILLQDSRTDINHAVIVPPAHRVLLLYFSSEKIKTGWDGQWSFTALHLSCFLGNLEITRELLSQKNVIDVNVEKVQGNAALGHASEQGHDEIVTELLKCEGINVNHCTKHGHSALSHACQKGHCAVVEKLLTHEDIVVNDFDEDGNTPLMLAIYACRHNVVQELLKRQDVNIHIYNNQGKKAIDIALEKGQDDIVGLLDEFAFEAALRQSAEDNNPHTEISTQSDEDSDQLADAIALSMQSL